MHSCRKGEYISPKIANDHELIKLMGQKIFNGIVDKVNSAHWYILCDC